MFLLQVKCVEVFKGFYETKTKHRKLTWIYSLGTCDIIGKFESKTIELIVSTYQVISYFAKLSMQFSGLELDY
jgi:hypothetical protein